MFRVELVLLSQVNCHIGCKTVISSITMLPEKNMKKKGSDQCSCEEKIVSHKRHIVVEKSLRHDDVGFVDVEVKLLSS